MKHMRRTGLSLTAVLALASCGGGESEGTTSAVTPTPAPIPAPTPAPAAVVISAVNTFALLSEIRFFPTGLADFANYGSFPSDQGGFYPSQSSPLVKTIFSGAVPSNYASIEKSAYGFDLAGGFVSASSAPADATVISPVTSLLIGSNTEAKLEQQLGIDGSLFGLSADRPIKTFSPTIALASTDPAVLGDGQRLIAHQLRVLAVSAALAHMGAIPDPSGLRLSQRETLRKFLDTAGTQFIYTNSVMSSILRSADLSGLSPRPVYSDEVISAAAHLVNAFCSSIGVQIATREQAARWQLAIWGYLVPELTRLLKANNSAAATEFLAITNPVILAATQRYTEQIAVSASDNLFPQPDFFTLAAGSTYLIPAVNGGSNGEGPLNAGDLALQSSEFNGIAGGTTYTSVTAVTVPPVNTNQVGAVLNSNGTVLITAVAGFTGLTYFDYSVRLNYSGETRQGRAYVTVR